ncbi:maltose/maltodextrin transport ATP-binding protein MalK [Vibrio maritimus]|uniref:Maltose/maltodextrin transport ATP-binding protein MalK n=1 Tax=Vibrio maritimus TaxID=990268 RepID=A0A090SZM5_9VIBR|nr:maltose/maltodextrin transport ATP-binding protein MalK [Vibrio maritimus]
MNFMSVFIEEVEAERVKVQLADGDSFWIPVDGTTVNKGDRMSMGVRPEHLVSAEEGDAKVGGEVMIVEKLGNETQVYLNLEDADADVIYRQPDTLAVEVGDKFEIGIPAHRCHLFHSDGKACRRYIKKLAYKLSNCFKHLCLLKAPMLIEFRGFIYLKSVQLQLSTCSSHAIMCGVLHPGS